MWMCVLNIYHQYKKKEEFSQIFVESDYILEQKVRSSARIQCGGEGGERGYKFDNGDKLRRFIVDW